MPLLLSTALAAQTPAVPGDAQTRAELINRQRLAKRANPPAENHPAFTRWVARATSDDELPGRLLFSRNGFGVRVGNVRSGGGFALGPRYYRRDLAGERIWWESSLTASFSRFWTAETRLTFPEVANSPFTLQVSARHADSPSLNFFGTGIGSAHRMKSNYRREDTAFSGRIVLPLWNSALTGGFFSGINLVNIGPGQGPTISSDRAFNPAFVPGLRTQSNYLFNGPFVTLDFRDRPSDPHRGTLIDASYIYDWDYERDLYSFRRLTAQVEQYIPFFNDTRVIALRARTEMSFVPRGRVVPFYLQPTLGGPDDLRGFDRLRFYDNNSLLLNAEYRFEAATALDIALFGDAGSVYRRPGLVGFRNMEESGGIGFRFKNRNQVFLRVDAGISREGFRVWFQFSNAFARLPLFR